MPAQQVSLLVTCRVSITDLWMMRMRIMGVVYHLSHITQQHLKALLLFSSHLHCLRHLVEEDLLHGRQGMMMMIFPIRKNHLLRFIHQPLLFMNGDQLLHKDLLNILQYILLDGDELTLTIVRMILIIQTVSNGF